MTQSISVYYDPDQLRAIIQQSGHREIIGGLWDEIGKQQMEFLLSQGLLPEHRVLDIGCGSLRLGSRACAYLNQGNYWGTDISTDLLDAGYQHEIRSAGLADRLPRSNLVGDAEFTFAGLPRSFDFAMAQSVFTHLPLNHMRLCFANLARHLQGSCRFYFTIFMPTEGIAVDAPCAQKDGVASWSFKDPYHHDWDDVLHAFRGLPWKLRLIGDWDHPRNQLIVEAILHKDGAVL